MPGKGDGIIVKLKTRWMLCRKGRQVESGIDEIDHFATSYADNVMVAFCVGIETGLGLRAADLDHQPDTDKGLKNAIHGGS